jgi:hypothetical protein
MRRYNIVSRILLILTVITFALAAPALVQDKRRANVDMVHVPEDVITVLGKRMDENLEIWQTYFTGLYDDVVGHLNLAGIHPEPAPPPDVPPPNLAEVHVPEVHVPPPSPADSERESMELDDDAPPASPKGSTESEDWYTASSNLGSSTESDSDSGSGSDSDLDSDRWSTISNAPSAESQSENLKAADTEMRGKAKVEARGISGTAGGVDTVNAAHMELRSPVVPGP